MKSPLEEYDEALEAADVYRRIYADPDNGAAHEERVSAHAQWLMWSELARRRYNSALRREVDAGFARRRAAAWLVMRQWLAVAGVIGLFLLAFYGIARASWCCT